MSLLEKDLYPAVEKLVKRQFGCFATAVNVGLRHGRIDVAGLRDVGGDLAGRDEMIAVEVKRGTQPFATCAGQTLGYSIYAEQCYLAEYRPNAGFTSDEEAIARRLGIGLIRIRSTSKLEVVLSAPNHEPIERLRNLLNENLGYGRCTICSTLFALGDSPNSFRKVVRQVANKPKALIKAVAEEKGIMYWLEESEALGGRQVGETTYRRRYVCPDCVAALFAHLQVDE